jgi:4-hydroxy-tetrahydrodipicolinate reductase
MMNVGLMGFGKTGKAVAGILLESRSTNLRWVVRRSRTLEHRSVPEFLGVASDEPGLIYSAEEFTAAELMDRDPVDVIVDFSSGDGLSYYAAEAQKRGVTIISAVSQYSEERLSQLVEIAWDTKVIHSPNITLGINFLMIAAKILKSIAPETDIEIIEEHFKGKPEVSGTAKVIAANLGVATSEIKTVRAGGIIGTHEILFGFPYQTVRLKHESIAREAFGNGILFAINNLPNVRTGLFTMEDLLRPYFALGQNENSVLPAAQKAWWKVW